MNLKLLKSLGALCKEQLPTILSGAAVIGVFATGIASQSLQENKKKRLRGRIALLVDGWVFTNNMRLSYFLSIIRFAKSANLLTKFRDKEKEPRLFQDSPPF